jgi:hypothetical protein
MSFFAKLICLIQFERFVHNGTPGSVCDFQSRHQYGSGNALNFLEINFFDGIRRLMIIPVRTVEIKDNRDAVARVIEMI